MKVKPLICTSSLEVAVGELNAQWKLFMSRSHLKNSSVTKGANHREQHKSISLFTYSGTPV